MWQPHEDQLLRKLYHTQKTNVIVVHFPNRTQNAIIGRANRLGLSIPKSDQKREGWNTRTTPEEPERKPYLWEYSTWQYKARNPWK